CCATLILAAIADNSALLRWDDPSNQNLVDTEGVGLNWLEGATPGRLAFRASCKFRRLPLAARDLCATLVKAYATIFSGSGFYSYRTTGRHSHHCHPGLTVAAGLDQVQTESRVYHLRQ